MIAGVLELFIFSRALVLGWKPEMSFDEGLRATIDWYLANRAEAERDPHA